MPALIAPLLAPKTAVKPNPGRPRANLAILGLVALLAISALPWWHDRNPILPTRTLLTQAPTGITDQLATVLRPGDRVVAPQPWASWVELADPHFPVFVDSRVEIFPSRCRKV